MDTKNLSIIRQSFANTVFTHKVHEVAAESQEKNVFKVKMINIVMVTLVLVLQQLQSWYPSNPLFSWIGSGISVAEIIFLIFQLSFSFEQRAIMHKNTALKFMGLRDCYRLLIVDLMNEKLSANVLISSRNSLQREYQIISEQAPQTGGKEYTEAQIRLNKRGEIKGEEFTWSDEEIDHFLPESLRMKSISKDDKVRT